MKTLLTAVIVVMYAFAPPHINTAPTALFETQINTLLEAFPTDFEKLKGVKSYSPKDSSRYEWKSKEQLQGATETYIAKMYATDKHLSLFAQFENYETKNEADAKYKALVEKVKACKINCCEMVMSEGKDDTKIYTDWSIKPGGKKIKGAENMVLRVKLTDHNYKMVNPAYGSGGSFYSLGLVIFKK